MAKPLLKNHLGWRFVEVVCKNFFFLTPVFLLITFLVHWLPFLISSPLSRLVVGAITGNPPNPDKPDGDEDELDIALNKTAEKVLNAVSGWSVSLLLTASVGGFVLYKRIQHFKRIEEQQCYDKISIKNLEADAPEGSRESYAERVLNAAVGSLSGITIASDVSADGEYIALMMKTGVVVVFSNSKSVKMSKSKKNQQQQQEGDAEGGQELVSTSSSAAFYSQDHDGGDENNNNNNDWEVIDDDFVKVAVLCEDDIHDPHQLTRPIARADRFCLRFTDKIQGSVRRNLLCCCCSLYKNAILLFDVDDNFRRIRLERSDEADYPSAPQRISHEFSAADFSIMDDRLLGVATCDRVRFLELKFGSGPSMQESWKRQVEGNNNNNNSNNNSLQNEDEVDNITKFVSAVEDASLRIIYNDEALPAFSVGFSTASEHRISDLRFLLPAPNNNRQKFRIAVAVDHHTKDHSSFFDSKIVIYNYMSRNYEIYHVFDHVHFVTSACLRRSPCGRKLVHAANPSASHTRSEKKGTGKSSKTTTRTLYSCKGYFARILDVHRSFDLIHDPTEGTDLSGAVVCVCAETWKSSYGELLTLGNSAFSPVCWPRHSSQFLCCAEHDQVHIFAHEGRHAKELTEPISCENVVSSLCFSFNEHFLVAGGVILKSPTLVCKFKRARILFQIREKSRKSANNRIARDVLTLYYPFFLISRYLPFLPNAGTGIWM